MTDIELLRDKLTNKDAAIDILRRDVLSAWDYIQLDEPVLKRVRVFLKDDPISRAYWNHHIALAAVACHTYAASYLEIGARIGASMAIVLNYGIYDAMAVDTWKPYANAGLPETEEFFKSNLSKFPYTPVTIKGNSHKILKTIKRKFDMILVDGDHSKDGATEDLEDSIKLLNPGGFIVFDDIKNVGCLWLYDVAVEFEKKYNLDSIWNIVDDNGTVIWQVKKND